MRAQIRKNTLRRLLKYFHREDRDYLKQVIYEEAPEILDFYLDPNTIPESHKVELLEINESTILSEELGITIERAQQLQTISDSLLYTGNTPKSQSEYINNLGLKHPNELAFIAFRLGQQKRKK